MALNPYLKSTASDSRHERITNRNLVRGLVPPEQGGVLNLPENFVATKEGKETCRKAIEMIQTEREKQGLPKLETYLIDAFGNQKKYENL